jgi:hypothetical protein
MNGKVELEIYRSRERCRWNWNIWLNSQYLCRGVEDTAEQAFIAARNAMVLHNLWDETEKALNYDEIL